MLTARQVADYFLALSDEDAGDSFSNLRLQKLLYYAQGLHLAMTGKRLFGDAVEAWVHGPVVPSVFHELKQHGCNPVPRPQSFKMSAYPAKTREFLNEVYEVYGQFSAWKLRDMTHSEEPWKDTPIGKEIKPSQLKHYFVDYVTVDSLNND